MADQNVSVQEIVERLKAGTSSQEEFRRLYEIFYPSVHAYFARRGFPPQDCHDLTQETFLGIYQGIATFRSESRFETWLFIVAENARRKRLRWLGAGKRAAQEVPWEGGAEGFAPADRMATALPAPGEVALSHERSRLLRQAIERLPTQMRKCLLLRVYRDLKYREIAVTLGLSTETVKVHLFHARKRLQEELGDDFAP